MPVTIRASSIAEIEGNGSFPDLAKEYANECAIHGLPPPVEKLAAYKAIESTGIFQPYAAFQGFELIGFLAILTPVIPHYGVAISVLESFFVSKSKRKTGAGLRLLMAAHQHARDAGSPGLLVSAPTGGDLEKVLPEFGYRETNRVFFRSFKDEQP